MPVKIKSNNNTGTRLSWMKILIFVLLASVQHVSAQEDYQQFLMTLENSFNQKQGAYFNQNVDFNRLLQHAFKGIEVSDEFKKGFSQGFINSAKERLADQFLAAIPEGKKVKLIKQRFPGSLAEGTIRFDFGDNGYGYIRLILKNIKGEVRIVDWFDYARGQLYSQSLSSVIRSVAPREGVLGRLRDLASNKKDDSKVLLELSALIKAKEFVKIRDFYQASKSQVENNWEIMTTILNSANMSGDEGFYNQLLNDIATNFEGQNRASFMLMDYYFLKEDYSKVIPILDALSEEFDHNDAAIYFLKLNAYVQTEEYALAEKMGLKAIGVQSDFEDAYWGLVSVNVARKDHLAVLKYLKQLESFFGYQFTASDFADDEYYHEFVKSQAFKDWL